MKKILLTTLITLFALSSQADLLMVDHTHNWDKPPANQSNHMAKKANKPANHQYNSAVKVAKAERKRAKKLGFEWRDIGKFLKQADKLYKKGDVKGALKLVNEAKAHALLGQKQAKDQANAGPQHF